MSLLEIDDLHATVAGTEILAGVDLTVEPGEVHAIMGPNGSGKSTLAFVLAGHPRYQVERGSIRVDGVDITAATPAERAEAGLFLALQYPVEVPGVSLADLFGSALATEGLAGDELRQRMEAEAARIGFEARFLDRPLNVDLSGGEKKRNETVQLGMLRPKLAVLDEIDSGLDIDALRAVSARVEELTEEGLAVVAITHYQRLFEQLTPDRVHVFSDGRIERSGGPEVAAELEASGYAGR